MGICQPTLHTMNLTSRTCWKVKGEGNSSVHTTCDESDMTYILEGEGVGQFISPHHMR